MNQWSYLRWLLVACWLSTSLYCSIPDYPYGVPLWMVLTYDANGWLHEMFYIAVGFLVLIDLTYRWERMSTAKQILCRTIKRIERGGV